MGLDFVSVILANLTLGPASPEEAVVVADQKESFLLIFLLQCDQFFLIDNAHFEKVLIFQPNQLVFLGNLLARILAFLLHGFIIVVFLVAVVDKHLLG